MNYPKVKAVGEHPAGLAPSAPTPVVGYTMWIWAGFFRMQEKVRISGYGMNNWVGIGQRRAFTRISSYTPPQTGSIL